MANATDIVRAAAGLGGALRLFQVSGNEQSDVSLSEWPASGLEPWQAPIAADGGSNATLLGFSAVCYIMGSTLVTEYLAAGGAAATPVGLVHSSHGGTSIQAWQSPASVNLCGDNSNSWNSSVLFNSNFAPLTVGPLALAAVYWCVRSLRPRGRRARRGRRGAPAAARLRPTRSLARTACAVPRTGPLSRPLARPASAGTKESRIAASARPRRTGARSGMVARCRR